MLTVNPNATAEVQWNLIITGEMPLELAPFGYFSRLRRSKIGEPSAGFERRWCMQRLCKLMLIAWAELFSLDEDFKAE